MIKIILIVFGCVSLVFGIIGIFLPLLPTTPFLLLASACFLKSSKRLHKWLIYHRVFGSYIRAYERYRAINRNTKVIALALLWGCIFYSVFFVASMLWLKLLLIFIAVGVTIHISRLKVMTKEMRQELEK